MRLVTKARISVIAVGCLLLLACNLATPSPAGIQAPASIPATAAPASTPQLNPNILPAAKPTPVRTAALVPTPTPLPAPAPIPMGEQGGLLRVAGFADVPHRDVHQTVQETLTSMGPGLAYSRLLKLQSGPDSGQPSLLLECDLCLSWELTADFAYEFQLRPDVRWQDIPPVNGRPLVADDLVFSYQRLRTPGWPNAGLFESIDDVEAVGSHGLRINLAFADADTLLSLADGHSKIVAREVVEQYGDLRDSPVIGTGPWVWMGTEAGTGTSLHFNPDYFEAGLPFLDRLDIVAIRPSGPALSPDRKRLAAFQAGAVDVALLPPTEWQMLQESRADAGSVLSRQAGTGVFFAMNVQNPPLTELGVRRAILRAIDPWYYVDSLWPGQSFASVGIPVQDSEWLLSRAEMRNDYFADPEMARELLAASGASTAVEIELTVRTEEFTEFHLALAQRVADDLRKLGLNPVIRPLDPSRFSQEVLDQKDYQLALGFLPPTSTTNSFLMALLHSGGRWNIAAHQDTVLDELIERQATEFEPGLRRELLEDIQRHVLYQGYLFSPISGASRWVFDPTVQGFYPNTALSEYLYWSRVWLDR